MQYKFPAIKEKYCNNDNENSWTQLLSDGGLQIPSQSFVVKLKCLNAIFNSYNGKSLKTGPKFIANQMALASEVNLEDCVKMLFFKCKMYFKIRTQNTKLFNSNSKTNLKKNKQFKN